MKITLTPEGKLILDGQGNTIITAESKGDPLYINGIFNKDFIDVEGTDNYEVRNFTFKYEPKHYTEMTNNLFLSTRNRIYDHIFGNNLRREIYFWSILLIGIPILTVMFNKLFNEIIKLF